MSPPDLARHESAGPRELPTFALVTGRHLTALRKLNRAFEKEQPVTLMTGDDEHEFGHVISAFLDGLTDPTTVVRLNRSFEDELAGMREITQSLGFEPKALSMRDHRNILTMFLQNQVKHGRRTLICVERADEQGLWLLDCITELFTSDCLENCRLMVVLSGGHGLHDRINNSAFEIIGKKAGRTIRLEPFTFSETKQYIDQRSELNGVGAVVEIFDFEAVDRLHKLSGGIPRTVAKLYQESLKLAYDRQDNRVTGKMVVRAARRLRLQSTIDLTLSVVDKQFGSRLPDSKDHLLIRHNGRLVETVPIDNGRFMIGRGDSADICLPGTLVSRRHALLIKTAKTLQLLDLGSKNGTYVGGTRIAEHMVEQGALITLADCEIECVLDS